MDTQDLKKWKIERSCLLVKKQKVVHGLTSFWGEVMNNKGPWIYSEWKKKEVDRASFVTGEQKLQRIRCWGSRSKPGTQQPMALLSQATSVSSCALYLPVFSSSGCYFGHQLLNHYYFITSLSPLCFKSNFKQKLIYQPLIFCHFILQTSGSYCFCFFNNYTINYINLKIDFFPQDFSYPFIFQQDQRTWF